MSSSTDNDALSESRWPRSPRALLERLTLRQQLLVLLLIPAIGLGWGAYEEMRRTAAVVEEIGTVIGISAGNHSTAADWTDLKTQASSALGQTTRRNQQIMVAVAVGLLSLIVFGVLVIRTAEYHLGGDPADLMDLAEAILKGNLDSQAGRTGAATGILGVMLEMQQALRTRSEADKRVLTEHARLCAALDCVTTNVMVCDMDMTIVYVNSTLLKMFRQSESKITSEFPDFRASEIVGRCVDDFHKSLRSQRLSISNLQKKITSNIKFSGEVFKVIINPVFSPDRERLGAVVEWENMTAERLRKEEEKLRNQQIERILDVLGDLRLTITNEGEITNLNSQAAQYLGYKRAELLNAPVSQILPAGLTARMIGELAVDGVLQNMHCMLTHADGQSLPVDLFGLVEFKDSNKRQVSQLMLLARPADSGGQPSDSLHLSHYLAEPVSDGIVLVDGEWAILSTNRSFCQIINIESAKVIGAKLAGIMPGASVFTEEPGTDRWEGEYTGKRPDKSEYIVLMTVHALGQDDGGGTNRLVTIKDITSLKESERHVRSLAYKDALTGLANRVYFEQRVTEATRMARRRQQKLAILFLDLDDFKYVNDSLGHAAGDRMLCIIGERIKSALRETDLIARLGGDEFYILVENINNAHDASMVAGKCLKALSETCSIVGRELQPTASVGITLCPDDGVTYAALLRSADSAMYAAKQAGKNRYAFYSRELTIAAQERLAIEHELRIAVRNGDFELYYQPQIELASGRMVAVEALIRWKHEKRGLVSPAEFIPVVERIGLIEDLGVWVLNEACHQAVDWAGPGLYGLKVAVNISGLHFQQGRIVEPVRQVLEATGLEPDLLELEVTETAMQTEGEALDTFQQLKELGISLAIDDFGTGFSCLNSIMRLPLDCLKVDKMFVDEIIRDPKNSSIVATIIAMGRAMGLSVVAEGVEELEQVQYLCGLRCALVQGYYFSRPVPAEEIPSLAGKSFYPSANKNAVPRSVTVAGGS